ncbi:protein LphB [Legionella cardiaca]|uniref:Protein LphB n=1 Tax=Legionella cardiaca TaxID=1071983 RepID=A0ABY8AW02_9GAMM|nr:protein LphB [Legionella cardiaca]WED43914.1 protein LphB [Legionella cardiaca]
MSKKKGILVIFLFFCFSYLLVLQVYAIWPFTIDDMYISLRYAKHWSLGHGLSWNPAEEPVEGYSSFSFVALAALAMKLNIEPVNLLKSLGVVGLVFSTISLYFLSRLWFSAWIGFIPSIWLLLYRGEIIWSVSGLETTVYQALLCASLFFLFRGMGYRFFPEGRKKANWFYLVIAGFLLAVAGLTRPEAPVLMLIFYGLAIIDKPKTMQRHYFAGLLLSCLTVALLFLPYFVWRWDYYGRLFPNAVYCKGFRDFSLELDLAYLNLIWPFVLFALPAIFKAKDKRHYFLWLPSLAYLLLLIGADPIVAFSNRLFLPVFILLLPLTLQGIIHIVDYCLPREKTALSTVYLVVSVLLFAFFFIPKMTLANYRYFSANPQAGLALRQQVVDWLETHIKPGSRVVLADSGMIPYLSSLNFVDSYCLSNKKMSSVPNQNMYSWLCHDVLKTKPEVIILTSLVENGRVRYTPTDFCLAQVLKNNQLYDFKTIYKTGDQKSSYRYEIYTLSN